MAPALGALLTALGGACAKQTPPPDPRVADQVLRPAWRDYVKTEVVQVNDTPQSISTTGRVTFNEDQTQHVGAPVNGRVAELRVRLGDSVTPGQPLVVLSSPEVAQLQADVKKAQQDLDLAARAWDRAKTLQKDGAVSDKEVNTSGAEYNKAKADLERGRAQLQLLGLKPSDPAVQAALYARIAGTVVERNILVGQEVRTDGGTPLLTLTNLDTVWVLADIYEPDLGQVKVGTPAKVKLSAYPGEVFAGQVAYIGDVLDPQTRTVKVRCTVPNADHRLKPEMFARVDLESVASPNAIYVPAKALVSDGDKTRVLVVLDNTDVRPRDVRVGPDHGGKQRVLEGLSPGDVIVTDGAVFLNHELNH